MKLEMESFPRKVIPYGKKALQSKLDKANISLRGDWFKPETYLLQAILVLHQEGVFHFPEVEEYGDNGSSLESADSLGVFLQERGLSSFLCGILLTLKKMQSSLNRGEHQRLINSLTNKNS